MMDRGLDRMMHVADQQLLEMRADALFTRDPDGRIRRINEPGGGRAPRFFFGRTRESNLWRFRLLKPGARTYSPFMRHLYRPETMIVAVPAT